MSLSQTYQQELDEVKLENKMLQEKTSELQSRLDTANKQVNTKYKELKDKEQHNTPAKDDLVCTYMWNYYTIVYLL